MRANKGHRFTAAPTTTGVVHDGLDFRELQGVETELKELLRHLELPGSHGEKTHTHTSTNGSNALFCRGLFINEAILVSSENRKRHCKQVYPFFRWVVPVVRTNPTLPYPGQSMVDGSCDAGTLHQSAFTLGRRR